MPSASDRARNSLRARYSSRVARSATKRITCLPRVNAGLNRRVSRQSSSAWVSTPYSSAIASAESDTSCQLVGGHRWAERQALAARGHDLDEGVDHAQVERAGLDVGGRETHVGHLRWWVSAYEDWIDVKYRHRATATPKTRGAAVAGTWSDDSSVYRRDPLTGDVVLYAPGRDLRPQSAASKAAAPKTAPPQGVARAPVAGVDPECPFCPGNEHLLPPIGWEVPDPTSGEWLTRVVPNKYPIVPGTWRHLVVIETPRHDEALESLPSTHLETVLRTYRRVFGEVSSGAGVRCAVLFRNQGVAGGASLAHPHTQVVGLDVVPDRVRRREARSHRHHGRTGRCLLCDTMAAEEAVGVRMVTATPGFVAFVPWAAEVPCDTWIVPRRHQADFRDLRDDEVPGLAAVFRDVLTRVGAVSSAYNVTLESCSLDPGGRAGNRGRGRSGAALVPARSAARDHGRRLRGGHRDQHQPVCARA